MQFTFAYRTASAVRDNGRVALQPDLRRKPTYFSGELADPIGFREAAGALHDVVISDRKYRPKDKTAYLAFKREQLARRSAEYWREYRQYMELLWRTQREALGIFDPVITVHPDEVFFEAFSKDESAYARLGVAREAFRNVGDSACGTTNIDFSAALYGQFQRIRSSRPTWLDIDASGFTVQRAGAEAYIEKKIDLPESWVRGFLQVQSAMTLPTVSFSLEPVDLYNLCTYLRRNREKRGPRALRWELRAGKPVEAVLEPWEARFAFAGSRWTGDAAGFGTDGSRSPAEFRDSALIIRTWGRRRIHLLERLLPAAKRVSVHLLGRGMPSFYVLYMGRYTFCLGLSGWTANDWSAAANFDLMTARADVDPVTLGRIADALGQRLIAKGDQLAAVLGLAGATVEAGLNRLCREGRAMYDWVAAAYRHRELMAEPLPAEHLAFRNTRVEEAEGFLRGKTVRITGRTDVPERGVRIDGTAGGQAVTVFADPDGRMLRGECGCRFFKDNKLRQGPCGHLLALLLASQRTAV